MTEPFVSLKKLREESEQLRQIEKNDNELGERKNPLWINYGETSASYDQDFGKLVPQGSLLKHVISKAQEYRNREIPYCVLDLFSPLESWLKRIQRRNEDSTLPIDGGVASTLSDPRQDPNKIKADERKNLYCIEGDILKPEPKQRLREFMDKLGITDIGFGMVVARPYGGAKIGKGEEEYIPLYYSFLRQVWRITSKHDGEIFCPVPTSLSNSDLFHNWVHLMRTEVGASVELSKLETSMKITRHLNSKGKLPGFSELGMSPEPVRQMY